jgi:hypothetical protein
VGVDLGIARWLCKGYLKVTICLIDKERVWASTRVEEVMALSLKAITYRIFPRKFLFSILG